MAPSAFPSTTTITAVLPSSSRAWTAASEPVSAPISTAWRGEATTTSRPRKKNPSQVAQAETPPPWNFASDGKPSHLACAPVAMISASQRLAAEDR